MVEKIPDPTGGEAATAAAESAKTGAKTASVTIADVREQLRLTGDQSLDVIQIAGQSPLWRVVRATESGHDYYSPALPLSKLVVWLDGWNVRDAELREQMAETELPPV